MNTIKDICPIHKVEIQKFDNNFTHGAEKLDLRPSLTRTKKEEAKIIKRALLTARKIDRLKIGSNTAQNHSKNFVNSKDRQLQSALIILSCAKSIVLKNLDCESEIEVSDDLTEMRDYTLNDNDKIN